MTEDEQVKLSRELWIEENNLINHRLSWLGVSQTIMLGGYGVIFTRANDCHEKTETILILIAKTGLAFSGFIFLGVLMACIAQYHIHSDLHGEHSKEPMGIRTYTTLIGWLPALAVPLIFGYIWCSLK